MNKKLKTSLLNLTKTLLPLLFGIIILWLVIKELDLNQVIQNLKDANYWIIALSLPFGLAGQIIRALRWELLIHPLGHTPKRSNLIYAVLGSYGVNLAFPRLGEIWRCTMISRYEKIPFTKLVGTMITDRIFDPVAVLLIVAAAFALNVPYFEAFLSQHPETYSGIYGLLTSVRFYIAVILAAVALPVAFRLFRHTAVIGKTRHFLSGIWEGILSIRHLESRMLFLVHTVLIWACYFLYFYICFYAFPVIRDLGFNCGLFAFAMGSIAMAFPVQGGAGVWQTFVITSLVLFLRENMSIDTVAAKNLAGAFAFGVWIIQSFLFTTLYGLFGIIALSVTNRKKR
ncbi:MAG: flippase-like domain-containing protein [Dysgonamonadaceae bacterium]|jgi:uncharacterized protein (TIRG00374 family)|nr:flippase-like domain-containing protein [Dysgonamonadaceae bacterium]